MMANTCASGKQCLWWVEKYLRDCVCGVRDYVSVGFGMISLVSWTVAEVPQIVTNIKNGSTDGVSLGFLMTWVLGDLFNLVGCWLESATLPTQLYTALLYTITTIVLVLQIIYYDHIRKWWKARKTKAQAQPKIKPMEVSKSDQNENIKAEALKVRDGMNNSHESFKKTSADSGKSGKSASSLPIPASFPNQTGITGRDLYYTSARSFASSHTPTPGSYVLSRGSGRSGPSHFLNQCSFDEEGLLTNLISASPKKSKTILRSVASTVLFVGGLNICKEVSPNHHSSKAQRRSDIIFTGRKLLQEMSGPEFGRSVLRKQSYSKVGTCLGWLMAAIYMGGRLPQIRLNIKRGTVEGLNPLMFVFALLGNATYVGSIIVRTLEWEKLKPNLPWLIDAAVCVLLDFFILAQFMYYKVKRVDIREDEENGDNETLKM